MSSIKIEARFVTRDSGSENDGLILGARMKGTSLKPGTVYELRSMMGEIFLVEVGPSAVKTSMLDYNEKPYHLDMCWGNEAGYVLDGGRCTFMTEAEAAVLCPKRGNNE